MKIFSIVTGLPPKIDGIGDYAINIAKRLRQDFSIDTHFIALGKNPKEVENFSVDILPRRTSSSLNAILDSINPVNSIVLVHYAMRSYGYKGCPFWLLNSLQKYKKRGGKLVIMFHEIYAQNSPIISTDFWLAPIQKYLVKSVYNIADQPFTNCENHTILLQNLKKNSYPELVVIPVPSTVGESQYLKPLEDRERRLIVFGQGGNKMQAYKASSVIRKACETLDIQEIWDIGPSVQNPKSIGGVPVIRIGKINSEEIQIILMNSLAGFINYRHDLLGKSSIFASYCANGLLPINGDSHSNSTSELMPKLSSPSNFDLVPGEHYLREDHLDSIHSSSFTGIQRIADKANFWYGTHDSSVQSKIFFEYLEKIFRC
jgi:hypothetical protein